MFATVAEETADIVDTLKVVIVALLIVALLIDTGPVTVNVLVVMSPKTVVAVLTFPL